MKVKKLIFKLALLCISFSIQAQVIIPNKDNADALVKSLNGKWKFKYIPSLSIGSDADFYKPNFDLKNWADIKVPGQWELQGFAEPKYGRDLVAGTGLYHTNFSVDKNWDGKQLYLVFDGVLYGYDFWINGKYVGTGSSAYNRKSFDITHFISAGTDNTLSVKVTTRNKGFEFDENDCWSLSGIFRDVTFIGIPKTHIKDFNVKTFVTNTKSAQLDVSVLIEKSKGSSAYKKLSYTGKVFSPEGKLIKEFASSDFNLKKSDTISVSKNLTIKDPKLWTAETPWLYNLELSLLSNKNEIQKIHQKIGIKQISTENGVLKLNGQPIKLRGVDHHDIDPNVGRALTPDLILKDLLLMKKANINFVRTSHYPPHPKMIELCDSLGIYVMCEVPFGYGDEHLKDSAYLDILLNRAKLTVERDKNHPSIIVWSIGNENPLTPITLKTGQYVKKMDPTRPICYPQMGGYFRSIYKNFPDSIDILSPHYASPQLMETYAKELHRPIITTEYAHSLGLDFDQAQEMVEVFYKYPILAGGSVWLFQDQGILRTADKKVDRDSFTTSVWKDSIHVYDNNGDQGADGIVYANRVPQVDYWQLRKIYSPVKLVDDSLVVKPGDQSIKIKIKNRFDFNDLSNIKGQWTLMADNKPIQTGNFSLKCNPHDSTNVEIPIHLPQNLSAKFYWLILKFLDQEDDQFTEKTYRLWPENPNVLENKDLINNAVIKPIIIQNKVLFTANLGNTIFTIDKSNGGVKIQDANTKELIMEGPFARVGRKATMSMLAIRSRDKTGVETNWDPFILKNPVSKILKSTLNSIECEYRFERMDKKGEYLEGSIIYTVSDNGGIDVKYNFKPVNATAFLLEAGISFQIPHQYSEMRWIGNGPYPSYPGKSILDEFGFYHLNSADINYQGNRSDVQLLLMTNKNGNGFAIKGNDANIAVENMPNYLLLSHNALVSGRYTKFTKPGFLYQAKDVKEIAGSFTIIPIEVGNTPQKLLDLFGDLSKQAVPFKPFYHSYDQ